MITGNVSQIISITTTNSDTRLVYLLPLLTESDIDQLEKAVLTGYAENISEGGFFYGHQFQEDAVKEHMEYDHQFVTAARQAMAEGTQVVYHCWW